MAPSANSAPADEVAAWAGELGELRSSVAELRMENQRLLTMLRLTSAQARPPGPVQTGIFDQAPGNVDVASSAASKVAFFRALFAARTDVYAVRWDNPRTGKSGWMPAIRGHWRKGQPPEQRQLLPLTDQVITAHLSGEIDLGLYPLLDGDRTCWLAADFDGPAALLDALAYIKAARKAVRPPRWKSPAPGRVPTSGCSSPRPSPPRWPGRSAPACSASPSPCAERWN